MTGKQIKRHFKKYLVDTKVEFKDNYRGFQIGQFMLFFATEDYLNIALPSSPLGLCYIKLFYSDAPDVFGKLVYYHQKIHGKGLRIQGRVRTLHTGKRQKFIFR